MKKRIHIVAGIIVSEDKHSIFITKRPLDKHKGGLWEFPGGKVENGESASDAIARELNEEVGIEVLDTALFDSFSFDYIDKSLFFDFITILTFSGKPYGKEGQIGQWVSIEDLNQYAFPEANTPIVEKVIQQYKKYE
ncbi:8-oxo-dGTP diphosphatase MutT [Vibrio sp.]|nr:8-oxo-dGTP diphosphatase MutT [Vibrio sp.]